MHRNIFSMGPFAVHSWGLMVAMGFAIGLWYAMKRAKRMNFPPNVVVDVAVAVIISAIIGSRLWYAATEMNEFRGNWLEIINPMQNGQFGISGMSMVGGVISAIIVAYIFCRLKKVDFLEMGDVVAPTFLLGMFFGRFGCFLNGCCFGHPSNLPWAAIFPTNCPAGAIYPHTPVHPTQIYESIIDLAFFFGMIAFEKKFPRKFVGQSFWTAIGLYAFGRVIVDYWRWFDQSEMFANYLGGNISIHGVLALALAAACAVMLVLKIGKPIVSKPPKKPFKK
jgi:phosphatidylglycerol---prolipoprotein diacylglyceryl transferase